MTKKEKKQIEEIKTILDAANCSDCDTPREWLQHYDIIITKIEVIIDKILDIDRV